MITGTELKQLTDPGIDPQVLVTRRHGSTYGAMVMLDPQTTPRAIGQPGSDDALRFESLDEVASFAAQVGIRQLQVTL